MKKRQLGNRGIVELINTIRTFVLITLWRTFGAITSDCIQLVSHRKAVCGPLNLADQIADAASEIVIAWLLVSMVPLKLNGYLFWRVAFDKISVSIFYHRMLIINRGQDAVLLLTHNQYYPSALCEVRIELEKDRDGHGQESQYWKVKYIAINHWNLSHAEWIECKDKNKA